VGAPEGDGRRVRRAADLRLAPLDHVLAEGLLFLRAPEDEISRGLDHAGTRDEVEAPITDWLREAYDAHDSLLARSHRKNKKKRG